MAFLARSPSTSPKYPPLPVKKLEVEINKRIADNNPFLEEFNASLKNLSTYTVLDQFKSKLTCARIALCMFQLTRSGHV